MPRPLLLGLACWLMLASSLRADSPADAGEAAAPQAVDLRPLFVPGRTARYEVWTLRDTAINIALAGRQQAINNRMEVNGEVTWTVERVKPDGGATCTMTLEWIAADLTGPDGSVQSNDSRKGSGQSPPVHTLLKAMAGVPLRVEVAADGSVQSVAGVEAIQKRAGDVPAPDARDFMESAADLAMVTAAPAAAAAGRSWEAALAWNHEMGTLHHAMTYTLTSVEDVAGVPVANINGKATLRLEPDMNKLGGGNPDVKIDAKLISGELTTQIMWDLQRHEAVGRNSTQTTVIETRLRAQGQTLVRTVRETIQSQALRVEER